MSVQYSKYNTYLNRIIIISLSLLFLFQLTSCKKYLDAKASKSLYVPSTLNDLQALLDNNGAINIGRSSVLPELISDNYYVPSGTRYNSGDEVERLNYIWDANANITNFTEWYLVYTGPIYYSNVVLDQIPRIERTTENGSQFDEVKGSALFYRAFSFYEMAQLYCRPYSESASTDLGIVLRTTAAIETPVTRATVRQTYDQIINDLKEASKILPGNTANSTRPNRAAAFGLLARTYLSMRDYSNAGYYADLSLQQNSALIDFNTRDTAAIAPFCNFSNPEINYYNHPFPKYFLGDQVAFIDTTLIRSYNDNDLRKKLFFYQPYLVYGLPDYWCFKGSYSLLWPDFVFDGIAVDEMYLIRAEAYARAGNKDAALADLNGLMIKRWKNNGTWTPFTASDGTDALSKILTERRKELVYRGQRWTDIRRLNLEGSNITLRRLINNTSYTLPPNDLRSVLLIPKEEISKSGIQQNPR